MNKTKNIIAGISLLALIAFLVYTVILINKPIEEQFQGEIEAREIKVSSKLTGRIDSLPILKGMDIRQGELLFRIESPEIHAKLHQAQAGHKAASAQDSKAISGARQEDIQAAYNAYQKALAGEELAVKTYERVNNLFKDGVVAEHQLDKASANMEASKRTAEAAKALYEKAKNGARSEDKTAAKALVDKANAVIEEVESYLRETQITAPINGEVSSILAEEGELIPAGFPAVSIVDLNDIWMTLNLKETFLKDIRKGSTFLADIPALGLSNVEFKVSFITPLGDYATWKATKEKGEFDVKTFGIEARPTKKINGLRPGMSVLINQSALSKTHTNE